MANTQLRLWCNNGYLQSVALIAVRYVLDFLLLPRNEAFRAMSIDVYDKVDAESENILFNLTDINSVNY